MSAVDLAFVFLGLCLAPGIFMFGFVVGLGVARVAAVSERERVRRDAVAEERRRFWNSPGGTAPPA